MTAYQAPAGWYPDPEVPGGHRYWGGAAWTEFRQAPAQAQPTRTQAPPQAQPTLHRAARPPARARWIVPLVIGGFVLVFLAPVVLATFVRHRPPTVEQLGQAAQTHCLTTIQNSRVINALFKNVSVEPLGNNSFDVVGTVTGTYVGTDGTIRPWKDMPFTCAESWDASRGWHLAGFQFGN